MIRTLKHYLIRILRNLIIFALAVVLLVIATCVGMFVYTTTHLTKPVALAETAIVDIAPGTGKRQFIQLLTEKKLIQHPVLWQIYFGFFARDFQLKYGEYEITPQNSLNDLLDRIKRYQVVTYKFTLVEGWNLKQVLAALAELKLEQHNLQGTDQNKIRQLERVFGKQNLEGWFFADTYYYHKYMDDILLLKQAYQKMQGVLEEIWATRTKNLPLDEPYEALILASIVEKEAGSITEQPLIAAVFINRLNRNMRLQSDPTVIYGLGANFDGNITRKHLRTPNAYNTYTISGLPATPIASVGRNALQAVTQPAQTQALYFVSRGDGSHYFSATLREHNAAVRRYQLGK